MILNLLSMSAQTEKMTEKRKSEEVQNFKEEIETFFKKANVPPEIQYKIRVDLSKKMDMPYYKVNKHCIKSNISCVEIAKKYIEYLIEYEYLIKDGKYVFSEKLINELTKHQQQTLRKIHPRNKEQKRKKKYLGKGSIWEHPIPTNYSKQRILEYIKDGNLDKAKAFIEYLSKVPQIALSKDNDRSVNADWKDSMPEWWNWEEIGKNDQFARYKAAKIPEDSYK
jgi:hypothetical protein